MDKLPDNDSRCPKLNEFYQLCIKTRNFEITQLVQRNNFFMVFQGVLLAGLMQASGGQHIPIVTFLVCLAGVLISIFQIGMAAGAKFWQERWEYDLEIIEKRLLEIIGPDIINELLFSKSIEDSEKIVRSRLTPRKLSNVLISWRFSVSRIPIYTGIAFVVIWLMLLACTIESPFCFHIPSFIIGFEAEH